MSGGIGAASSAASSSRSWSGDAGEHQADAGEVERRRALVQHEPRDHDGGHGEQREHHGEPAHRDPPQHVLVDAVADGVREHADEEAGDEQARRRPDGPLPGAPTGVSTRAPIGQADAEAGEAPRGLGDA